MNEFISWGGGEGGGKQLWHNIRMIDFGVRRGGGEGERGGDH